MGGVEPLTLFTPRRIKFVDFTNGDDSSDDGTIQTPYKTITTALSTVTDASQTTPYQIIVLGGGVTDEPAITWKPNVSLYGDGASMTQVSNAISWADSDGETGSMVFANVALLGGLTIDNMDDGSVDLILRGVDVTALTFKAGIASAFGELYANGSIIRGDSYVHTIQRGWIMSSTIYGNLYVKDAGILLIEGCKVSSLSDIGTSPAAIRVGDDSVVTVVGGVKDGTGSSNYTVIAAGTSNMKIRYDASSTPESITGSVSTELLDNSVSIIYTPSDATKWASTAPTTVKSALDRMASLLKTLNSNIAIP